MQWDDLIPIAMPHLHPGLDLLKPEVPHAPRLDRRVLDHTRCAAS